MRARVATLGAQVSAAWPSLRALFVVFHVAAVVILSLPAPAALTTGILSESENTRRERSRWSEGLRGVGVDVTAEVLEERGRSTIAGYAAFHERVAAPFAAYARASGAMQGWAMFASPQQHPAELHLDLLEGNTFRPLYRPHSREHDFWGERLRHNRMRKQLGRLARSFDRATYERLAKFLAREAAAAYPEALAVRVRLYRYATLPPEAVRAGQTPAGRYEHARIYVLATLRSEARR